jgi:hypothetical protein
MVGFNEIQRRDIVRQSYAIEGRKSEGFAVIGQGQLTNAETQIATALEQLADAYHLEVKVGKTAFSSQDYSVRDFKKMLSEAGLVDSQGRITSQGWVLIHLASAMKTIKAEATASMTPLAFYDATCGVGLDVLDINSRLEDSTIRREANGEVLGVLKDYMKENGWLAEDKVEFSDSEGSHLMKFPGVLHEIDPDTLDILPPLSAPPASRPPITEVPSRYLVRADGSHVEQTYGSLTLRSPVLDEQPPSADWAIRSLQWLVDKAGVSQVDLGGEVVVGKWPWTYDGTRIDLPQLIRTGLVSPANGRETTARAKVLHLLVELAKSKEGRRLFGKDFLRARVISLDAILSRIPHASDPDSITEAAVIKAFYACHEESLQGTKIYARHHPEIHTPYEPVSVFNGRRSNPLGSNDEDVQVRDYASIGETLLD